MRPSRLTYAVLVALLLQALAVLVALCTLAIVNLVKD